MASWVTAASAELGAVGAIARMFSHAGDEAMPLLGWVMRTVDLLARADAA
jgi:hypothetical protein